MSRPPQDLAEIPIDELVTQLSELGVAPGTVLLVHTAFRQVRPVERGPHGFIEALTHAVGSEGTVIMPSWPEDMETLFDPSSSPPDLDLGVVAGEFWKVPGVRRTDHVQAFAARGPQAERVLADPLPLPPHRPESPVGRVHELGGLILLAGVSHDANTTIHLAEVIAGVPYGKQLHCTALVDGRPTRVEYRENDHCCRRFRLADDWLRDAGLQTEGMIGHAYSRLVRSRDVVETIVPRLERDPLLFLHAAEAGCVECNEARSSVYAE